MKEVIIEYTDGKVLQLLKSMARHLGFVVKEKKSHRKRKEKKTSFDAIELDTRGYRFDREAAHER